MSPSYLQVLEEYHAESPLVLCAKVLSMYTKLKQVKLELFGEHSQFSIALKDGFTKAFQSLEAVRSVQVWVDWAFPKAWRLSGVVEWAFQSLEWLTGPSKAWRLSGVFRYMG